MNKHKDDGIDFLGKTQVRLRVKKQRAMMNGEETNQGKEQILI